MRKADSKYRLASVGGILHKICLPTVRKTSASLCSQLTPSFTSKYGAVHVSSRLLASIFASEVAYHKRNEQVIVTFLYTKKGETTED